jgi:hypothetical protein
MKKLIIISGSLSVLLNLLIFLVMSSYHSHEFYASEMCLIFSIAMIFFVSISTIDNAFKISLLFLFSFLAVVKFLLAMFFKLPLTDNYIFLSILVIMAIEIFLAFGLKYFSKYS